MLNTYKTIANRFVYLLLKQIKSGNQVFKLELKHQLLL